jgi:hypothetical protein
MGLHAIENARYWWPPALRGAAIIRLRTVEDTISAGELELIDPGLRPARPSTARFVNRSHALPPSRSYGS